MIELPVLSSASYEDTAVASVTTAAGANIDPSRLHIHHIAYSAETLRSAPGEFLVLDNTANPRPDWYEYWPIRQYLATQPLQEDHYYGFLSPRFQQKTGLTAKAFISAVLAQRADADIIFCSPQPEVGALFQNVYFGSDAADPGSLALYSAILDASPWKLDIGALVNDARDTVYSNYFVARPRFWRVWFELAEAIFRVAEDPANPFSAALNGVTSYGNGVMRKVFLIEGLASALIRRHSFRAVSIPIRQHDGNLNIFSAYRQQAETCNALKAAFNDSGAAAHLEIFAALAGETLNHFRRHQQPAPSHHAMEIKQTPAHDLHNDTILQLLTQHEPHKVVEVGCMRGSLATKYREIHPDSEWTGIDIDADNVRAASGACTSAILGDVETMDPDRLRNLGLADAWVFGDVLEHLRDPWSVLRRVREQLTDDGVVIACIPNSQHWYFQARVNAGLMQYEDDGLFDRTHLRFFSRLTMIELFQSTGYELTAIYARQFAFPGQEKYMPSIRAMAQASGADPDQAERDASAFQYVLIAKRGQGQFTG